MNGIENISCRLCFKTITDTSFQAINDYIKGMLNAVLDMKFESESKQVICNACIKTLNAAFELKTTCLITNNTIISYADSKDMLQVDLREVYMKENGTKALSGISNDQQVCVLCMQLVENEFRYVQEEEAIAVQKFFPEMNINIVKDPIVCHTCFDSLCSHNSFVQQCLETQRNTLLDLFIKTENLDEALEITVMENPIKFEFPEVKSENDSFVEPKKLDIEEIRQMETSVNNECMKPVEEKLCEEETKEGCTELNQLEVLEDPLEITTRPFVHNNETKAQMRDILETENLTLESYKCGKCVYETIWRSNFARHMLRHTDPSLVKLYACDKCDFKSKYQKSLNYHQLRHTNPSHIRMYKCEDCEYETKHRNNLPMHRLMHKRPSEVPMYKCDSCPYEAKRKRNLISHQLRHRNPGEVQMYGCDKCEYKTKYRWSLPSHQMLHQSDLEAQMYRCDECDYETRHKNYMPKHKRMHKVKTYEYKQRQRRKQEQAPSVAAQ